MHIIAHLQHGWVIIVFHSCLSALRLLARRGIRARSLRRRGQEGVQGRRVRAQHIVVVVGGAGRRRRHPLGIRLPDHGDGRREQGLKGRRDEVALDVKPAGEGAGEVDRLRLAPLPGGRRQGDGDVVDRYVLLSRGGDGDLGNGVRWGNRQSFDLEVFRFSSSSSCPSFHHATPFPGLT